MPLKDCSKDIGNDLIKFQQNILRDISMMKSQIKIAENNENIIQK